MLYLFNQSHGMPYWYQISSEGLAAPWRLAGESVMKAKEPESDGSGQWLQLYTRVQKKSVHACMHAAVFQLASIWATRPLDGIAHI